METRLNADDPKDLSFADVAQPGAVISNAWPQSRATEGATLQAIEKVLAKFPFFEAFQTVDVPFSAERRAIRQVLAAAGRPHTYTLTRILGEQQVNISSLDPGNRRRAIAAVFAQFDHAEEAGARMVAVISGARPTDAARRIDALAALEDSLGELCMEALRRHLQLLIEPLDCEAHKRQTLGTTTEAVAMCRRLAAQGIPLSLCLDTSHLILNGEECLGAVEASRDFIAEFHFCNPVMDRASPLYGDQHPPFGSPGVVGIDEIAAMLGGLFCAGFLNRRERPRVYCEVMKPAGMTPAAVIEHCQDALLSGWRQARQLAASNEPERTKPLTGNPSQAASRRAPAAG
jgi:sugar phosphate isomerase/epimerase